MFQTECVGNGTEVKTFYCQILNLILLYLNANNLVYYGFIDVGRRHKILG